MNEFEITIPNDSTLMIDVTNKALYNYDFGSYSLVPLQKVAEQSIETRLRKELLSNVSVTKLIQSSLQEDKVEYVARFSDVIKKKIATGELSLGIKKSSGDMFGVLKNTKTGKAHSLVSLDKKTVDNLGNLPEMSAIQGQLADITEQIEGLNRLISRVEQGQYNDRFAGYFSARQLVVEALASDDDDLKKELFIAAIKTNNDTIAKLMFSVREDANAFTDMSIKAKEAKRIDNFLQNSIGYLNASVQLNLVAYSAIGEKHALMATLANYQAFLDQTLLKKVEETGKSVAWRIDNAHSGNEGQFNDISQSISIKIDKLLTNMENKKIESDIGDEYDK